MGGGDDQARKDLKKAREQALAQLERIFEGPLQGLRIAPEFFKLAGSPELAGTPVGRGLALQNQILDAASGGLAGTDFNAGRIPADLRSAVLEAQGGASAGRGLVGGAANLDLANRFSGVSEQLRASRIQSALSALGGTGASASVLPSAQFFGELGARRALAGAEAVQSSFGAEAQASLQAAQQQSQAIGSLLGFGLSAATGGALGGFGALGGLGLQGGLMGALGGAASFSGLAPAGAFGQRPDPFQGLLEQRFGSLRQGYNPWAFLTLH